ncbi:hypothetical protein [Psychrobacillus sp. MER TA 171]|uniref:hypothetical protein n=1 Tax=Psychrobacillus sp. MER TA 171 TaxID=2939577 RepID=UPI00204244F4|nr:hypothetical protein [Psychrobacillus sp. MER TA 171]MCM3359769.1 hypothetical protein [Psychrobacillus sp. MER TA 171]
MSTTRIRLIIFLTPFYEMIFSISEYWLLNSMLLPQASSVRQGFAPSVQGSSSFPPGLIPSPQGYLVCARF